MSFTSVSPPSCYGKQYDNEADMCRACSFNAPCRREVMKVAFIPSYQPPVPVNGTPYQIPQPVPPYYNQVPVPPPPPMYQQPANPQQPSWNQYRPFQPPPPPSAFQPGGIRIPVQPAPIMPQPITPNLHQTVQQVVQHVLQDIPYSPIGVYGAMQDPAIPMISSKPRVMRNQMNGESFLTRLIKNLILGVAEAILDEVTIGVRQAYLPPRPNQLASNQTIRIK